MNWRRTVRWLPLAVCAGLVALGAGLALWQLRAQPAPPLVSLATTYAALGQALAATQLAPLPATTAQLQSSLTALATPQCALTVSTDNMGQPNLNLGTAITVLTQAGRPVRYLLFVQHWSELSRTPLGPALQALAGLPLAVQHPLQVGNNASLPVYEQNFYFDYQLPGQALRFTPQFEGQQCVRVDVTVAPPDGR